MTVEMYQKRIPIYVRSVKGRFRTLKFSILAIAYGTYFLLPWLRWERAAGPDQAVLFDIAGRRFYIFDLVVYAQDIFWLAGLLVIAALLLFFVTGLAGRVFCGYFCFQTLWTDVFVLVEHLVQGERNARMRLARAPWNAEKIWRMGLTWLLWLAVALSTGLSFTLYWGNAPELLMQMLRGEAPFPAYATTIFLTLTTFVMAGLAREQVCTYMCPYARFQGAMFDKDTLIVAYDEARGEGEQGHHKPGKGLMSREERHAQGVGDCIDCGFCVQVCPTGIDIRNGMQYQCISCALCIDACNTIMDSIGYPRGLIRYSSENHLHGKKVRWFKPKNLAYGMIILGVIGLLSWSIVTRTTTEMSVRQIRQPLAVMLSDGHIQNRYEIKLNNKTSKVARYRIRLEGLPGAELDLGKLSQLELSPEQSVHVQARVRQHPRDAQLSREEFQFVLEIEGVGETSRLVKPETFFIPEQYLNIGER